jgi:hydantoinase/carbamoylase family amidase
VDTVPDGGRYDGALGTVVALELAHDLRHGTDGGAGFALLVCAAEEAPRFGAGTVGSRLLTGALSESALNELRDGSGATAADARRDYRSRLAALPELEPPLARVRAHAEVHVALRRSLHELGIVRRVAAPHRLELELTGEAGHSGEISMVQRRDALAAAAEVVLTVERVARAEPPQTVATTGRIEIEPGAISVIPGRVLLGIELRALDPGSLARLEQRVRAEATEIAGRRGVGIEIRVLRAGEPVELDEGLAAEAMAAAKRLGIAASETWSGSGHDAQHLAALMPTLLLFVPLRGGESHTPFEDADPREVAEAAVLAFEVLRAL